MILAVDVGNTTISVGFFKNKRQYFAYAVPTEEVEKKTSALFSLRTLKRYLCHPLSVCIVCSVVPALNKKIKREVRQRWRCPVRIIGKDCPLYIRHRYRKFTALGADRIVNIYGALQSYTPPFVIIDFGTAITFDYVNRRGIFAGGLIVPGVMTSLEALAQKGALLPNEVALTRPHSFLGRSTIDGMRAGTVYGFAALTDGLIDRLRKRYTRRMKVILTGGSSSCIHPYIRSQTILDQNLTIKALYLIAQTRLAIRL